jgi:hypothetical protein
LADKEISAFKDILRHFSWISQFKFI